MVPNTKRIAFSHSSLVDYSYVRGHRLQPYPRSIDYGHVRGLQIAVMFVEYSLHLCSWGIAYSYALAYSHVRVTLTFVGCRLQLSWWNMSYRYAPRL